MYTSAHHVGMCWVSPAPRIRAGPSRPSLDPFSEEALQPPRVGRRGGASTQLPGLPAFRSCEHYVRSCNYRFSRAEKNGIVIGMYFADIVMEVHSICAEQMTRTHLHISWVELVYIYIFFFPTSKSSPTKPINQSSHLGRCKIKIRCDCFLGYLLITRPKRP